MGVASVVAPDSLAVPTKACPSCCSIEKASGPAPDPQRPRLRPTIRATSRRSSSVISSGPKPADRARRVEVPAVLRQARRNPESWDRPTQARRSAARVSSVGTPGRQERADVGFRRDRFDRRQARQVERNLPGRDAGRSVRLTVIERTGRSAAKISLRPLALRAPLAPARTSCFVSSPWRSTSRFLRDQRARKFSGSLIFAAFLHRSARRQRLRIGTVALALVERPLDVVLGDEGRR